MRTGIFFFFNLGYIAKLARIGVVATGAILFFRTELLSAFYGAYTTVFFIALAFALIPAPSDQRMMNFIEAFYQRVVRRAMDSCELVRDDLVVLLKAFERRGAFNFCRQYKHRTIYMHAAAAAIVEKSGRRVLVIGRRSLISAGPDKFEEIVLSDGHDLTVRTVVDEEYAEVIFHSNRLSKDIVMYCRTDFRYRDFLAAMGDCVVSN